MKEQNNPVIDVSGLCKSYGSIVAVEDVSLSVERGEIVGILGPNGAGKTTLIKCLLGLVEPTDGTVRLGGRSVTSEPTAAYRHVGAMLEGARNVYWRLSVRENLAFFSRLVGVDPKTQHERHDELLDRFELAEKADTAVNDLSRGQKQKVALACALARDVDVIFLDEPTLGLDVESSRTLRAELDRLVREESLTVVLSSHDMDVIQELCDRVVVLQDGSIIADEDVEDLMELFRTQSYRIEYVGELPAGFEPAGAPGETAGTGERHTLEGSVDDVEALSALLDRLVTGPGVVDRLEITEPDLEEAFLRLTEDTSGEDAGLDVDDSIVAGDESIVAGEESIVASEGSVVTGEEPTVARHASNNDDKTSSDQRVIRDERPPEDGDPAEGETTGDSGESGDRVAAVSGEST